MHDNEVIVTGLCAREPGWVQLGGQLQQAKVGVDVGLPLSLGQVAPRNSIVISIEYMKIERKWCSLVRDSPFSPDLELVLGAGLGAAGDEGIDRSPALLLQVIHSITGNEACER